MKYLKIIGTSHIAAQSMNDVEEYIIKERPEIVALELDRKRLYGLLHKGKSKLSLKDMQRIGLKGFLFSLIGGWAQKKMGSSVGVEPGAEMLKAVHLSRAHNLKIALIDQDIEITLRRIKITWKEKLNLVVDIFESIFFRKRELKKFGITKLDLTKVPSKTVINKIVAVLKKRYPSIYRVLIEERNIVMARNLSFIIKENPEKKVLAVVGAGHEEELLELVKQNL